MTMDGMTVTQTKSKEGDVHVMPNFGREHVDSSECWCRPKADPSTLDRERYAHTLWIHELEQ